MSVDLPPPKPDDMPTDEYVESWFGGGLCGVLIGLLVVGLLVVGLLVVGLLALIVWLFSGGMDTTSISF